MDLTSAIGTLGSDYVNKVTSAMKDNASLKTTGTSDSDTTFDAIYDSVAGIRMCREHSRQKLIMLLVT